MAEKNIIKLTKNPQGFGKVADELADYMFESPLPKQHTHSYYEDEELGLYIGVWDTTDMVEVAAPYSCDKFMSIIEGTGEIKNNKTGMMETVIAGESFVIGQGYDCQWQQKGYLRMFYVIYEPPTDPLVDLQVKSDEEITENVIYIDDHSNVPWQATSDGHRKKVLYQNHKQTFTAGVWSSNGFNTGEITFPYNEFIIINQGSLICTDEQGEAHKISVGEALFIPQGVRCSWQAKEKICLHFVQIKRFY